MRGNRRTGRPFGGIGPALCLLAAIVAGNPAGAAQQDGIFGFAVGEERRYTWDGEESLKPGEIEEWTITLEHIEDGIEGRIAYFKMTYESVQLTEGINIASPDRRYVMNTYTDAWVNAHGFPLRVIYREDNNGIGNTESRQTRHAIVDFVDGVYRVYNELGVFENLEIKLPDKHHIDLDEKRGLYLTHSLNPGLLALPFATLVSPQAEEFEYTHFDPRIVAHPFFGSKGRAASAMNPATGGQSRSQNQRQRQMRGPMPANNVGPSPADAFRDMKIELEGRDETELGGLPRDAVRVRLRWADGNRDHWVTTAAQLLRIDERVRLLLPSEY